MTPVTGRLPEPPLLLITDRTTANGKVPDIVRAALEGGCRWVMLRDKDDVDPVERDAEAAAVMELCRSAGAVLIVNGDAARAALIGAGGVHLQRAEAVVAARGLLGEDALIGVSCHSPADLREAGEAGADYATMSPVFLTESKPGYGPALGLEGLREAFGEADLPVLALAGVDTDNAADCISAGAAGIAVMGGIMRAENPKSQTALLVDCIGSARKLP